MSSTQITTKKKIAFGLGNIGGLAIGQSSILLLYTYYFLYLKVPLSALGISLVLVVYGIWDALNEPLIGHISDMTRSRLGRRKPFILAGIVPLVIFAVLIYTPPVDNPVTSTIYLCLVLIAYETCVTMVITSWYSLYAELSLEPKERLDISKFMQIFGIIGLIIGLGVAPIIAGIFENPLTGYAIMGLVLGLITGVSMIPTLKFVKERPDYQVAEEERVGFVESVKTALKSKSFVYFVVIQFLLQLSYALVVSSLPLFFEGILGLGSLEWSILLLATFLTVIPSLYLWMKVAEKKGSKHALLLSMLAFSVVFPLAFLMVNPIIALIVLLLAGIGLAGLMMFPTILLGDVIDEDQTISGRRREGLFTGVSGVIVKLSSALSWGIIGIVLTLFQVDRDRLAPDLLTPLNRFGLQFLVGLLPVLIVLLGIVVLRKYPLTGERLERVKEKAKYLSSQGIEVENGHEGKSS